MPDKRDGKVRMVRNRITLARTVQQQTEALNEARFRDGLTGLFNREMLKQAVAERVSSGSDRFALLAVGLPQLELVAESHGQDAADCVLKNIASVLYAQIRPADLLARTGDQSLVLLVGNVAEQKTAENVARRVLSDLSRPVMAGDTQVYVNCGIGVSMFPDDGGDASALINNAESALRRTQPPGDPICFYSSAFSAESQARMSLEAALRRAVAEQAFELHFQPRVAGGDGQIVGAEALLRWRDPEHGPVSPGLFVPLLESTGLIVQVGKWVIEQAARNLAEWHALKPDLVVSVNVSAMQFRGPSIATLIGDALEQVGLPRDCGLMEVELTESLLMSDSERHHLQALAAANISLAIDDFGTGYSALGYLLDMPFDVLKVDRSFVTRLAAGGHVVKVMHAIIAMAHALDMTVVAEGVETEQELRQLLDLDCDEIQGYYTGKPMPVDEFTGVLQERDAVPTTHDRADPASLRSA